jgi:uncharacterized protein YidB (DUF937 family)
MGLIDEIAREVLGGLAQGRSGSAGAAPPPGMGRTGPSLSGAQSADLGGALLEMLAGATRGGGTIGAGGGAAGGGLGGLRDLFQQNGLGNVLDSWVSTGQNQPISPDDVTRTLGRDRMSDLSQRSGLDLASLAPLLATLLPQLIDRMTPQGNAPRQDDLLSLGMQILRGTQR